MRCWCIATASCSPTRASWRCSNLSAAEVVGKPLTDFVAPEYAELVANNLRRSLLGEPAAERYEVELIGAQAQVTRVELSSTVIDSAGEAGAAADRTGNAARVRLACRCRRGRAPW